MTTTARNGAPTTIVFGTDGWRARIADEFTFDNVRRCADGVAHYVVEQGMAAKGVVVAYDRRFASEHFAAAAAEVLLAHDIPVVLVDAAVPTQMSSYEVVERGAAAGIVITASHNPWIDNGFKVKAPTGSAAGPDILAGRSRRDWPSTAGTPSTAGRSPTPRPPGSSSTSTRTTATSGSSAGRSTSMRCAPPTWRPRRPDVRLRGGLDQRLLAGGRIRVTEIHQERNPYFGGVNPEPIRPHVDEALGDDRRRRLRPRRCCSTATRIARARPTSSGTFIHQLQVTGLLMYYLAEHRGWRDPVVVSVNNTSMAARLGEHYGIDDPRDAGRLQVHRPEDDRDRRDDGRRGIGRLRVRDAPAGARRDLRRPAAAGPVRARAGRRALAGVVGASSTSTRSPARRSTGASTCTSSGRRTRRSSDACSSTSPRGVRPSWPAQPVVADRGARHRRRLQVLPRRRVVAAHPRVGHGAARPGLHGGDLARRPREAMLVAGERLVRGA